MRKFLIFLIKILAAAVILFAAAYYSFNTVMSAFVHEKAEVTVPDLNGKTLEQSLDILSGSKLALLKEGSEFNQDVPQGVVIRQLPASGMNVKEGKTVKVTVSRGGEIVYVPNLTGQSIRACNISLRSAGLILGELTKKSSIKYEEGIVLGQDPQAGTVIAKDSPVSVLVSNGAPSDGTVLMIDWTGQNISFAKEWAAQSNYDVEVIERKTSSANSGEVFDQSPKPDEILSKNSKIVFYVADKESSLVLEDKHFSYTLPSKGEKQRVRLVLSDDNGEKDIFNGIKNPGSKISLNVKTKGKAVVKVFFNNISVEDVSL